jgi:CubicO group peptidase (beta-lactamase class C family)
MQIPVVTPEEAGIPSEAVKRFLHRLEANQIPMHSVLLLHKDKLFLQSYYAPYTSDMLHRMFSISKSLTALAIALLAEDGLIHSLDDPICDYFPEYVTEHTHPWILAMTIREMLSMRTCHASTTYKLDGQSHWVESFFTVPPTHPSGKLFHYDTSAPHTLAALVEKLSGQDMLDYLRVKCLDTIGFSQEAYMIKDPFGVSMGGSGLVATSMDMLRLGLLLLHHGKDGEMQLLPPAFLAEAISLQSETMVTAPCRSEACGYGYQIWKNEQAGWVCYGMGGQLIIGEPSLDFLCVTTADTQGIGGGNQMIYDALYQEIYPYLSRHQSDKAQICESPAKHPTLYGSDSGTTYSEHDDGAAMGLAIASIPCRGNAPACFKSGRKYHLLDNPQGFREISLSLNPAAGTGQLRYLLQDQAYSLPFGLGEQVMTTFPAYSFLGCASGNWLSDGTFYIRFHLLDEVIGSIHFQLSFGDEDITVFIRKQEESYFQEYDGIHLYGKQI